MSVDQRQVLVVQYTNWRGKTATRRILPQSLYWGSTVHHPEEQWLLEALDVDREETRTFALRDIVFRQQYG